MTMALLSVALGLVGLFLGGNWLVDGASNIANRLGIPPLIIGLTVVALGTSSPELLVSIRASLIDSPGIALGNVVGSNIANVGLILGITGLICPLQINDKIIKREIPILTVISVIAYMCVLDHVIGFWDGILLLGLFVGFNLLMFWVAKNNSEELMEDIGLEVNDDTSERVIVSSGRLVLGIAVLILGAQLTVQGGVVIAETFAIPDVVIGLTLVAFGTSLPELSASIVAALRGKSDLLVGNIIGSNISNLLLILGVTSVITAIPIDLPVKLSPIVQV